MLKKTYLIFVFVLLGAMTIAFFLGRISVPATWSEPPYTGGNLPLYEEISSIKDRLEIVITEPGFTNPVPECDIIEWRAEDAEEFFQTTVNYVAYQHGKGVHGDVEAYVEIYNSPDSESEFIVEIARNSWDELTIKLDGQVRYVFPTVKNNTISLGYVTFPVSLTPSPATRTIPKVGVYYYPWYIGNWRVNHRNCPDTPYLGEYDSSDPTVILQHLNWLRQLGINFIILSWSGKNSPSDNNAKLIAEQIAKNYTDIQFFLMVEPFAAKNWNETFNPWPEAYNASSHSYNFNVIYDYIYNTYVVPFNSSYFRIDDNESEPVIGFYHGPDENFKETIVPSDARFTLRVIGYNLTDGDDWEYQIPALSSQPVCRDEEISVCPRYDYNYTENNSYDSDINYTDGLYDKQWTNAIKETNNGNVKIITIISWNEYAERTQIEPTFDKTSIHKDDPFYLFNKTQDYIKKVKTVP
jgi:hypothetical protein